MRFQLTALVDSETALKEIIQTEIGDILLTLRPGKEGTLGELTVAKEVPNYAEYLPEIDSSGDIPAFRFNSPPFADELLSWLHHIESIGALWLFIRRVHWHDATQSWHSESPEEEAALKIQSIRSSRNYRRTIHPLNDEALRQTLILKQQREYLVVPMSFYREGLNDHEQHRYVNAFFNFYFFLEGLYGKGKTKNPHVERAFLAAPHVTSAAQSTLQELQRRAGGVHLRQIEGWLKMRSLPASDFGLVKLLVWMRGNLHHFSPRSTTPKWHPLNQRDYESLSFTGLAMCANILPKLMAGETPQ